MMPKEYDLAVAYLEGGATYYVADRVKAKKKVQRLYILIIRNDMAKNWIWAVMKR